MDWALTVGILILISMWMIAIDVEHRLNAGYKTIMSELQQLKERVAVIRQNQQDYQEAYNDAKDGRTHS